MNVESLSPNLMVSDVQESLNLYIDVLGFSFGMGVFHNTQDTTFDRPPHDQPLAFVKLDLGDVSLMLQSKESMAEDVPHIVEQGLANSAMMYMVVDSIENVYTRAKNAGVIFAMERRMSWYGNDEFMIQDRDGNILGIGMRKG